MSEPEDWIAEWNRPANLLSNLSLKLEKRKELELHVATYP